MSCAIWLIRTVISHFFVVIMPLEAYLIKKKVVELQGSSSTSQAPVWGPHWLNHSMPKYMWIFLYDLSYLIKLPRKIYPCDLIYSNHFPKIPLLNTMVELSFHLTNTINVRPWCWMPACSLRDKLCSNNCPNIHVFI